MYYLSYNTNRLILNYAFTRDKETVKGSSQLPRYQKLTAPTLVQLGSHDKLMQYIKNIFQVIQQNSVIINEQTTEKGASNAVMQLRTELLQIKQFGNMTCDALIQLGALCGFLPPIVYAKKELPKDTTSGSNKYVSTFFYKTGNISYKDKKAKFDNAVKTIRSIGSSRISASDIENCMCELHRNTPPHICRKKDIVFCDISSQQIQNFFRVHKTNSSMLNSVRKYKVQVFHKLKWKCVDAKITPIFTLYNDMLYNENSNGLVGDLIVKPKNYTAENNFLLLPQPFSSVL